ncbi:MAG: hypothetical protein ACE5H8_09115 [Alphaproteobacteria bacterium]
MQNRNDRKKVGRARKWAAIGAAGLWILTAGWFQFVPSQQPSYSYQGFQTGTAAEQCRGKYSKRSFSERYACTTASRLAGDQMVFVTGVMKVLIVFLPPLLLAGGFRYAKKRKRKLAAAALARRKAAHKRKLEATTAQTGAAGTA